MRTPKKVIDKRYEDKHREERKAKNATFGTSMPRDELQRPNAFLEESSISKVQLIYAGWKALEEQLNTKTTSLFHRDSIINGKRKGEQKGMKVKVKKTMERVAIYNPIHNTEEAKRQDCRTSD